MVFPNITRSLRCTLVASGAVVRVTGLRAPCSQIDKFRKGLRPIVTVRSHGGVKALKAGVMGVVVEGGRVTRNDSIAVFLPDEHVELKPV
jgi:MOSC domain-containing protein YiiM